MANGWTGGQYSLYRAALGLYLAVHFLHLLPYGSELFSNAGALADASDSALLPSMQYLFAISDAPWFVAGALASAALASIAFALGAWDRAAAVYLWLVWASLLTRNPLIANPGIPFVGWLLLAHAAIVGRPYLSWAARGRVDPGGNWRMPGELYAAAWIVMALGYSYSGSTKLVSPSWIDGSAFAYVLENPLARPTVLREWMLALPAFALAALTWSALGAELLFAPLALVRSLRPWIWTAMVAMHLGLIVLVDFADLTIGMLMLHFFTFDPAWIAPLRSRGPDLVLYDGHCGLCHRTVRFLLAEDRRGDTFRFTPLDSAAARRALATASETTLPDSVAVVDASGRLRLRSDAAAYALGRLGGIWRLGGSLLRAIPRPLRDRGYDFVAAVRHRIFARPSEACPLIPPAYRERFADRSEETAPG